jgi:hypothetical protein
VQVHDFRAGLVTWIDEHSEQFAAPVVDGRVTAQLGHQRRVQRMQRLVSVRTIPRLVEL